MALLEDEHTKARIAWAIERRYGESLRFSGEPPSTGFMGSDPGSSSGV
jgi:hypothetical protein